MNSRNRSRSRSRSRNTPNKTVKTRNERYHRRTELRDASFEKIMTNKQQKIVNEAIDELSENKQTLIRQASDSIHVRNPHGTSSCRHLQMLYLLYPLIYKFRNGIKNDRKILSELWRNALKQDQTMNNFYGNNRADVVYNINLTSKYVNSLKNVSPMGLVKQFDGHSHIMHYFLFLKEIKQGNEEYYIYSAYGSGNVCVYPKKIMIDLDEFYTFIDNVNYDHNNPYIKYFIRKYFLNEGVPQINMNEGRGYKVWKSVKKGANNELTEYDNPFKVVYFPTVTKMLQDAAQINIGNFSGGSNRHNIKIS